ncbi:hypothetical protein Hypma_001683 [Hypsizygus marmoreus]|uniref:Uncharacterized protein n=1 Tax=Hypsizygus marmoreus TaxID=39966 RepID=A0A369J893_HYPMA|nr:hypothetical protein Hypma_001683 [Hypsizygus marmoreus]
MGLFSNSVLRLMKANENDQSAYSYELASTVGRVVTSLHTSTVPGSQLRRHGEVILTALFLLPNMEVFNKPNTFRTYKLNLRSPSGISTDTSRPGPDSRLSLGLQILQATMVI